MSGMTPELTAEQARVLRWLDENPSHRASWTIGGKPLRKGQSIDLANTFTVEGANGTIHISQTVLRSLDGYVTNNPGGGKMYGVNDAGAAALKARAASGGES